MSDKVEPVKLESVLQINESGVNTKAAVIATGDDGTEYVSLDEVYEITGQESIGILGDNCREWNRSGRLNKSAFSVLKMDPIKGLMPGYDVFNGIKGGESWLDNLKKGFIYIVEAVKKFISAVIDWTILRIKTIFGFSKTSKEIAIIADVSDDVKIELARLLKNVANTENINFNAEELYSALPDVVTTKEAFKVIKSKTSTALEQLETIEKLSGDLENAEKTIIRTGEIARLSRSKYTEACKKLRRLVSADDLTVADILEFRHVIDEEIIENLDYTEIKNAVISITEKLYGIDLGNIGIDETFKNNLRKHREDLDGVVPVVVTPDQYKQYKDFSKRFKRTLLKASNDRFNAETLKFIKETIDVKDAELIDQINKISPDAGVLTTSYTNYCAVISQYTMMLETLISIVGNVKKTIAGVVNWSNKIDKLMLGYIIGDINKVIETEEEILPPDVVKNLSLHDSKGNRIGSIMDVNYDALYISKYPVLGAAVLAYRGSIRDGVSAAAPIIKKINRELKNMGINKGIKI